MNFFHVGNTFFLEGKELVKFENIYGRLMDISGSCHSTFSVCQDYENCFSYVGMHVDGLGGLSADASLPAQIDDPLFVNNIKAYLIIIIFSDYIEVYDVCTETSERGRGRSSELMSSVASLSPKYKEKIWIGILPENKDFKTLLSFYARKGFADPYISAKSPGGRLFNFYFIGLWYEKDVGNRQLFLNNEKLLFKYKTTEIKT